MGDLTKNFSRKEFSCKCGCGFDSIDHELLCALQNFADRLQNSNPGSKISINVNSGCRCLKRNTELKGAKTSQHLYGRAADIVAKIDGKKVEPKEVTEFFKSTYPRLSTGTYQTFNHIDSRTKGPVHW